MPATNELPTGFASPLSARAARLSATWSRSACPPPGTRGGRSGLADRPTLIVADVFGDGPLSAQVDATYNSGDLRRLTSKNEHGYHVVGIAASRFSTNGTAAGNVTGVFSAITPLHVIEVIGSSTQMIGVRIVQQANARTGRVVVNTSLGWDVAPPDAEAQQGGSDWAQLVRGTAGLEDRVLHATSAGNDAGPSSRNSRWSASLRSRPHRRGRAADGPAAQHARGREPRRDARAGLRARLPRRDLQPRRHDRRGRHGRPLAPVRLGGR